MKKLFWAFLSFFIIISLTNCRHSPSYKIGISQCSTDDWRQKMNDEVLQEAMLHDDVEVEIRSADDNSQKQIEDLEYFASNGFDVIVVAPNEANTITPEIKKIYDSGIPIVIFDRNIIGDSYTQNIGVDNKEIGRLAAQYALHLVGPEARVIEIYGLPGSTPADERSSGFDTELISHGGKILGSSPANWQQHLGEKAADSLLNLFPEANLIFAHNDRMAIGAADAAKKLRRDNIKIIGIDAAPKIGLQAVADGKIDATFLYPTEGDRILQEAIKIAKGEKFDREIMLPATSAVDDTNADILILQNENIEENSNKVKALKNKLDNYISLHSAQTALVYAVIAIAFLLFGVLFLVLRTFWTHKRHQAVLLKQNKMLEEERDKQKELNQRLEEATQSKLVFFTNVSHDLRTPLTLIAEPVNQLKDSPNLDNREHSLVKIADKNIRILQRLINQILDFRKFENNKLMLSLTEIDFGKLVEEWLESFQTVAKKRDIKLILNKSLSTIKMAIDTEKIERVFFNLVSNALKYSPDNSEIKVDYFVDGENLVLKVSDSGEGISREDIKNIFDRFFQVDRVRPKGSGIGLSLAKAFVELHNGTISVESQPGKGSVFTVTLPIIHVSDQISVVAKTIHNEDVDSELATVESDREFVNDNPLILVIDDNKDIREMISELMKDDYNIITAPNGKEGIRKASKYVPDLIICDVMMPEMDGMECCGKLKAETITSHIPVLMLTACSLDEQRVQGFESGADAYISKPFSSSVLKAQSASLIANRKRIKDIMGSKVSSSKTNTIVEKKIPETKSDIDNDFFNKFLVLFEEKMGDPDLNVEAIAAELGFERTQFYRKIKAITNYSPVELMRSLRLKKARTLLKTSDKTISEICYEVGFSTPAYFTKCYREQFGETPSETRG